MPKSTRQPCSIPKWPNKEAGGKDQTRFVPEVLAPPGTQTISPCQNDVSLEFPSCFLLPAHPNTSVERPGPGCTSTGPPVCAGEADPPTHPVRAAGCQVKQPRRWAGHASGLQRKQTCQRWIDDRTHSSVQFSCPLTGTTEKSVKTGIIFRLEF